MAERVRVRGIDDDEGERLVRIVRRGAASAVTWRRAQMVLLSAQNVGIRHRFVAAQVGWCGWVSSLWAEDGEPDPCGHAGPRWNMPSLT